MKKLSNETLQLMEPKRKMRLQDSKDASRYRRLKRQVSKSLTCNLRRFTTKCIKDTIKWNQGSKVFAKECQPSQPKGLRFIGLSQLARLKTDDGCVISFRSERDRVSVYNCTLYKHQLKAWLKIPKLS